VWEKKWKHLSDKKKTLGGHDSRLDLGFGCNGKDEDIGKEDGGGFPKKILAARTALKKQSKVQKKSDGREKKQKASKNRPPQSFSGRNTG